MTRQRHNRLDSARAPVIRRRVVAAAAVGILAIVGLAPPAGAQPSEQQGLDVTQPGGYLHLENLSPGQTRYGQAVVTNHHDQAVAVDLTAEWSEPPLADAGVQLAAQLCASEWENAECASGAEPMELSTAPVRVGTLEAGESWHLRLSATLDAEAGNDTQQLSEDFTLRLVAEADAPSTTPPPPDDGEIPETGVSPWPLVAIALALVVAGGLGLTIARRSRGGPSGES